MSSNIVGIYDSFSIFRYVQWGNNKSFNDLSDLVTSNNILYALENDEDMSSFVFSSFNNKCYFADSFYEALDTISNDLQSGKVICGLSQSVRDQDEDGIFEVLDSMGGRIEFTSEFDDPRDFAKQGHGVLYFKCSQNIINLVRKNDDFEIVINGTGPMHIKEIAGFADADETRTIIFFDFNK